MFFKKLGAWIKKHLLWVISVILIVSVSIIIVLFKDDNSSNNSLPADSSSTGEPADSLVDNSLKDGTYSCELMYDGKSLDNEDVIKAWLQKLDDYDISIFPDDVNISDVKEKFSELSESGSIYIIKDKGFIKLYFSDQGEPAEYIRYDISNKKFILGKEFENESEQLDIETFFNNSFNISLDKDSFTFGNFFLIFVYPSIYNNYIKNGISQDEINIDYDKYTGLGDLVCKNPISVDE